MKKLISVLAIAVALVACGTTQQPTTPTAATPAPAAAPAAPEPVEISVTTTSPEALEVFKTARQMVENFHRPQAMPLLKRAIELDPTFAQAHALLGTVSPNPEGLAACEKAVALAAALPEAERMVVENQLLAKQGDDVKLVPAEKKLAELAPTDWRAQLTLAGRAQGQGKLDEAFAIHQRVLQLAPKNGMVHGSLGYLLLEQKKPDEAVKAFEQYAALSPTEANAPDSLADAYLAAGRLADAEAAYLKAIALDATFVFSWNGVAVARALQGNWAGAEEATVNWRKGAPMPNDQYPAAVFLAWLKFAAGKDADAMKQLDEAQKFATEQKLLVPTALIRCEKAELLNYMGKPKDAVKQATEALSIAEKSKISGGSLLAVKQYALSVRAQSAALLGKKDDANKVVAEATEQVKSSPDDARLNAHLHYFKGEALWAAGDAKGAAAELAQCYDDDSYCLWRAVQAQLKAGDKDAAAALTAKLVKTPRRDSTYIFVRSKLGTIAAPAVAPAPK